MKKKPLMPNVVSYMYGPKILDDRSVLILMPSAKRKNRFWLTDDSFIAECVSKAI